MGPLDAYIVYRFIRLLSSPWDETQAFKLGVIDPHGEPLVAIEKMSDKQRAVYTLFDRLVFNIKRLIEKLPGGKSKIGTYASAMYLFKEQMGDEEGQLVLEQSFMTYLKENDALELDYLEEQYKLEEMLAQGNYKLLNNMLDTKGNTIPKGTTVVVKSTMKPSAKVLGVDVYELQTSGGRKIIVSHEDIREV